MVLPVPTATVVDVEAAYLAADPALTDFEVKPVAWSRTRADASKRADLRLTSTRERRVANGKVERAHVFELQLAWPIANSAATLQEAQAYLHSLVETLSARIHGALGDSTHGGLFLSVAEDDAGLADDISVTYPDPSEAQASGADVITATVTYGATQLLITS